jgi:O-antigen/teichoic acid export membrane protein
MAKSVKVNYFFNLLNTVSGMIFPLLTFPYVSRVIHVSDIGTVNFLNSIICYVSTMTSLGIPLYALREIARVRDNPKLMSRTAVEILFLHFILTILGYLIVGVLILLVSKIRTDLALFLILSSSLFFSTIGCNWFYQGIEDFSYITIRGLCFKIFSVIFLFFFVRSGNDVMWYACYTVIGTVGGNIFNLFRLRKYLSIKNLKFSDIHPFRHLLPSLHVFLLCVITSIYLQLNTVMLGFLGSSVNVGLFTAATKLANMLMGITAALVASMLPRLSNLIAVGDTENFKALSQKSMKFIFLITLPLSAGLIICAPFLIPLFCGTAYSSAIFTSQLIAPEIFFMGVSNILGSQILYPQGKVNIVIVCTAIGAVVNVSLNLFLIPYFFQNGAAISTSATELIVTLSMMYIGRIHIPIYWLDETFMHCVLGTSLMVACLVPFIHVFDGFLQLLFLSVLGSLVYFTFFIVVRDSFVMEYINALKKKFIL